MFFTKKWAAIARETELEWRDKGPLINLSAGGPSEPPPDVYLAALAKAAAQADTHNYTQVGGTPALRRALAHFLRQQYGIQGLNPDMELMASRGSSYALMSLLQSILHNPGGEGHILLPEPGYPGFSAGAKRGGFRKVVLPITLKNDFMPDPEIAFRALSPRDQSTVQAIILNYPSNPTGAHATADYIRKVLQFAERQDLLVISDMAYGHYARKTMAGNAVYPSSVYAIAQDMDREAAKKDGSRRRRFSGRVVELHSLSKLGFAGDGIGCVIGPAGLIKALTTHCSPENTASLPAYIQSAAAAFLTQDDAVADTAARMNRLYGERFEFTCGLLEKLGWPVNDGGGPFFYWGPIPEEAGCEDSDAFARKLLRETGVLILPGTEFGGLSPRHIRIAMTQPLETLELFGKRLEQNGFKYA